jgi:hypothetical protein
MNGTSSISHHVKISVCIVLAAMSPWFSIGLSRAAEVSPDSVQPIDLTGKYTTPRKFLTNENSLPAWKTVALGHQVFRGVPFQIEGLIHLWGEGRSTNHTSPFPEQVRDIAVGQQVQTLYVCHGSYFKSPSGTPVFRLVFRYQDGSSATNTLCFGADILDWLVGSNEAPLKTPSSPNSMMAWIGGEFSPTQKNRIRFCMTAVDNPHPERSVATIDLISCKSKTVPFILAMTAGPAGLMRGSTSSGKH